METEVKDDCFIVTCDGILTQLEHQHSYEGMKSTMRLMGAGFLDMSFSYINIPKMEELSKRFLSTKPIQISISFPLITENDLRNEEERKRKIEVLKNDIKMMETQIKALEEIGNKFSRLIVI